MDKLPHALDLRYIDEHAPVGRKGKECLRRIGPEDRTQRLRGSEIERQPPHGPWRRVGKPPEGKVETDAGHQDSDAEPSEQGEPHGWASESRRRRNSEPMENPYRTNLRTQNRGEGLTIPSS